MPFFNVSKKGKTLQKIYLRQRPDPVLLTLPQASSIRVITFDQHLPRVFGKSGFFRQQLMTSISRQRLNFRNAHQDLTADLYPWYRDLIWKNWFSRTKISFSFFTIGTLSIHKRRRCDRKMSYTNMIICRDCCPKFATGLKCLNRHRSKNIWMTRLFFCQDGVPYGKRTAWSLSYFLNYASYDI